MPRNCGQSSPEHTEHSNNAQITGKTTIFLFATKTTSTEEYDDFQAAGYWPAASHSVVSYIRIAEIALEFNRGGGGLYIVYLFCGVRLVDMDGWDLGVWTLRNFVAWHGQMSDSVPFKETCWLCYLAELVFLLVFRSGLGVVLLLSFFFCVAASVVSHFGY